MPGTKRPKIAPTRIDRATPAWVRAYVQHGVEPDAASQDGADYAGWLFWNDPTPGLPADEEARAALIRRARLMRQGTTRRSRAHAAARRSAKSSASP
jgi:hypothetical protein